MDFKETQKLAERYLKRLKRDDRVISIVQIGSSLRENEFMGNSDLDLLIIYKNSVKNRLKLEYQNETEVNLVRRGKQQYLKSLRAGNPVDLIALKFGRVLLDKKFFKNLRANRFKPTTKTVELWMHTASFSLSDAFNRYSFPSCMCCYFKALHHAARDFSRAIILKENKKLVEGDKDLIVELNKAYPKLVSKYKFILNGRKNFENFRNNFIKTIKIERNQRGKFLLACEDFAILAYRIVLNINLLKINSLISKIQTKYNIGHFSSCFISPERKQLLIFFVLRSGKMKMLKFDLVGM